MAENRAQAAADRRARAVEEERAREERADAQRRQMLSLRAAGVQYPDISRAVHVTAEEAVEQTRLMLEERGRFLESADAADLLELERLDAVEQRVQAVLQAAAQQVHGRIRDPNLVLRAADRLLLVSERRLLVQPARGEAGEMETAVLRLLATYPEPLQQSPDAVAAKLLARRMDAGLPAIDLTGISRELRVTLRLLASKAPQAGEGSVVDELRKRREKRLADTAL